MGKRLEIEQKFYFKDIQSFYHLLSKNNFKKIESFRYILSIFVYLCLIIKLIQKFPFHKSPNLS